MSSITSFIAVIAMSLSSIHAMSNLNLRELAELIIQRAIAERELHRCGTLQAGLANLDDTVVIQPEHSKDVLMQALSYLKKRMNEAIIQKDLPDPYLCKLIDEQTKLTFMTATYRSNHLDEPKRKQNWSYRFAISK
jgi:hypothetical protein